MDKKIDIQDTLSVGYLYLIVLGIFSDVIYFKFIGINILYYSDIMDVILTPINILVTNLPIMLLFAVALIASYFLIKKNKHPLPIMSIAILMLFLGFGIGKGVKISKRIESMEIKLTHSIVFNNGKQEDVAVLGQTSNYLVYLSQGKQQASITPIANTILKIEKLATKADTT